MRGIFCAFCFLLASLLYGSTPLAEVLDPNLSTQGNPHAVAGGNNDFFIVNYTSISGQNGVVGWYYAPGSSTALEVKDPNTLSGSAVPNTVQSNSSGGFFIANNAFLSGENCLIGWYYSAGSSTVSEVIDPNSITTDAFPLNIAVDGTGNFFITNNQTLSSEDTLVGWYYVAGASTASEVLDTSLSGSAAPYTVYASATHFFIVNNSSLSGTNALVGWQYTAGDSIAHEVQDPSTLSTSAVPNGVFANGSGNFFIVNNQGFETGPALVGWYYVWGDSTAAEQVDSGLMVQGTPSSIAASGDSFFITSNIGISGAGSLIGWYFDPDTSMLTEITGDGSSGAAPNNVSANGSGDFFITNNYSLSGMGALVGWHYVGGMSTAATVTDSNTLPSSSTPFAVAVNTAGNFLITNSFSSVGVVIGWYYDATAMMPTLIEVEDPDISANTSPFLVSANSSNHFFITNGSVFTGSNGIVGWYYNPGDSDATEITDPDILTGIGNPAYVWASGGNFFITNSMYFLGTDNLIGWYYDGTSSTLSEILDPAPITSQAGIPNTVYSNGNGHFFITNQGDFSDGEDLLGWYYTAGSSTASQVTASITGTTQALNVYANGEGNFFISNGINISGMNGIVGWYYVAGESTATTITDLSVTGSLLPGSVIANSTDFFISNNRSFPSMGGVVGWYYTPGSPHAAEITNSSAPTGSSPYFLGVNGSGNIFITNSVNSGNLVGWYYVPGDPTASPVTDPSSPAGFGPSSVSVNNSGYFFISNGYPYTGSGGLVGWYYTPGNSTAAEVTDPATPPGEVYPSQVSANGQGNFFIANDIPFGMTGGLVGWYYVAGESTAIEAIDTEAAASSSPLYVSADSGGGFFITNNLITSSSSGLVGWYYTPGTLSPSEEIDSQFAEHAGTPYSLSVNTNNVFFIVNNTNISGNNALVGWTYESSPPSQGTERSFRRPNNRR